VHHKVRWAEVGGVHYRCLDNRCTCRAPDVISVHTMCRHASSTYMRCCSFIIPVHLFSLALPSVLSGTFVWMCRASTGRSYLQPLGREMHDCVKDAVIEKWCLTLMTELPMALSVTIYLRNGVLGTPFPVCGSREGNRLLHHQSYTPCRPH
jgi:hypothetical protein